MDWMAITWVLVKYFKGKQTHIMKDQICLGIQFLRLTAAADFKISPQKLKLVENTMSLKVFFSQFKDLEISTLLTWIMGETMFICGTLLN